MCGGWRWEWGSDEWGLESSRAEFVRRKQRMPTAWKPWACFFSGDVEIGFEGEVFGGVADEELVVAGELGPGVFVGVPDGEEYSRGPSKTSGIAAG